jgi:hypothetical protein
MSNGMDERTKQICGVKLYDADDGIFAGYCRLPPGHKGNHHLAAVRDWANVPDIQQFMPPAAPKGATE